MPITIITCLNGSNRSTTQTANHSVFSNTDAVGNHGASPHVNRRAFVIPHKERERQKPKLMLGQCGSCHVAHATCPFFSPCKIGIVASEMRLLMSRCVLSPRPLRSSSPWDGWSAMFEVALTLSNQHTTFQASKIANVLSTSLCPDVLTGFPDVIEARDPLLSVNTMTWHDSRVGKKWLP